MILRLFGIVAAVAVAIPASAETLRFDGRIEASERAEISSRLNAVVVEVLFRGGEEVTEGAPLIRLDQAEARLALAEAEAGMEAATGALAHAEREADRISRLRSRGIAADVQADAAGQDVRRARTALARANIALERAKLDVSRTVIRAPISGRVGRPRTSVGAFLEAESGAALGEVIRMEPVLVAYRVPYAARLNALKTSGAASLDELLDQITLRLLLPNGETYPHRAKPDFATAVVDPADGAVTVWAAVANPDGLLRPGLDVTVISEIGPPQEALQ